MEIVVTDKELIPKLGPLMRELQRMVPGLETEFEQDQIVIPQPYEEFEKNGRLTQPAFPALRIKYNPKQSSPAQPDEPTLG